MVNNNDESEGLKFNTAHLMQTTEEVAKAFIASASAATVQPARPSVVYSSGEESGSPMQKLQQQFSKILKGFSNSPEVSGTYNPEILTTHKRQWSRFQLKSLVCLSLLMLNSCISIVLYLVWRCGVYSADSLRFLARAVILMIDMVPAF
jgi:hypothetical protein